MSAQKTEKSELDNPLKDIISSVSMHAQESQLIVADTWNVAEM